MRAILASAALVTVVLFEAGLAPQSQPASANNDWPAYRRDGAGTGYSPLREITTANAGRLAQAWTYGLQDPAPAGRGAAGGRGGVSSQATPIVVGGRMFLPTSGRIVALDPASGKEIWQSPVSGGAPSRRGVAYWRGDGSMGPRIIFTAGRRLIALSAATGAIETTFGKSGEVDLVVPYNSVPLISGNIVVVGANTVPTGAPGNARAFDARTGAKLWEFNSVPQPGEVGHDTWEGDSWKDRAGANAWPFYFTLDEARGLVYIPLASPIPGAYGGDREGANLFGNSVVAIDLATGKYRWHFQTIHHDLWDADPPAPPSLFDVVQNGRTIPALGVTTKSGYLYILDRETGKPIFGVEERSVPKSDVPGEAAFPTQPFPVKPPPMARNSFAMADLVTAADTSAEHAAACQELVKAVGGVSNDGPFTPWRYRAEGTTTPTTLVFPGGLGGSNWGGTAFDPGSRFILAATQDIGALGWVEKTRPGSASPYDKATGGRGTFDVRMGDTAWPCQKPPWGRLTAVNTATGDVAWRIPLGITEQLPADKQRTGRPVLAGPIVTAGGVVFIASTDDNRFRALDVRTGREIWTVKLERRGNADPIAYGVNSKQYVAVVATDTLVVYALP